jgi:Transcription factor zinc-finger
MAWSSFSKACSKQLTGHRLLVGQASEPVPAPKASPGGDSIAPKHSMNCPFCRVALKAAGHRGVEVSYCPLCGGTWMTRWQFDRLCCAANRGNPPSRRLLRIALLILLLLAGCLIATIRVGS